MKATENTRLNEGTSILPLSDLSTDREAKGFLGAGYLDEPVCLESPMG